MRSADCRYRCVWVRLLGSAGLIVGYLSSVTISASTPPLSGQTYQCQNEPVRVVSRDIVQMSFGDLQALFNSTDADYMESSSKTRRINLNIDNSNSSSTSTNEDIADLRDRLLGKIQSAFGLDGLGFLEVSDLPSSMVQLRQRLLPMAAELANLPREELDALELPHTHYTIGWSHGKERLKGTKEGDYDLAKGSFYLNPFFDGTGEDGVNPNVYPPSLQPQLEEDLLTMTRFMAKVGLWIAQLCDWYLEQQNLQQDVQNDDFNADDTIIPSPSSSVSRNTFGDGIIYNSLKSCQTAKARLLYYFPPERRTQQPDPCDEQEQQPVFDDWCGWHKDHGSLTALLPGMLCGGDSEQGASHLIGTNSNTAIMSQSNISTSPRYKPGLYIQTRRQGELVHAQLSPTSLGFQLGETLEIMSRGQFRATPHAVKAPPLGAFGTGRSSLAVFLQPTADQKLPSLTDDGGGDGDARRTASLQQRWRPTFGAFQKATTEAFN